MTEARAEMVRARPWRRVAATLVDSVFFFGASSPGVLLLAVANSTWMMVVGGLLLVLPWVAGLTAFAALGNTLGGWLLGVRVMRNSRTPVGGLGHLLRWFVISFQVQVLSFAAQVLAIPFRERAPTTEPVASDGGWRFDGDPVWSVIVLVFFAFNLWLMTRGRGLALWDRMMGTFVVEERRHRERAIAPAAFEQRSAQ